MLGLGLSPAIINGYPFYFEDSAGYDGHGLPFNLRSDIPGAISTILYPIFGVWSLVILNNVTFAFLIARFTQLFLPQTPLVIAILVMSMTVVPFYLSLLTPDIWIVFLFLSLAMLVIRFSWFDFAIAVITCSGHGSNIYILAATSVLFLTVVHDRRRFAMIAAAICACSVIVVYLVDIWIHGNVSTERLRQATVASKIMNDVPEALDDYCHQQPEEKICKLRSRIAALPPHSYDDAQYLWHAKLSDEPGAVSWEEFNVLGSRLLRFVLFSRHAAAYLNESFGDYISFFNTERCLGFSGFVRDAAQDWTLKHYAEGDSRTLARAGVFLNKSFCEFTYGTTITVYIFAVLILIRSILDRRHQYREYILLFFVASLLNDIFLALFSGGYPRYHLRALPLLGISVLMAFERVYGQVRPELAANFCGAYVTQARDRADSRRPQI